MNSTYLQPGLKYEYLDSLGGADDDSIDRPCSSSALSSPNDVNCRGWPSVGGLVFTGVVVAPGGVVVGEDTVVEPLSAVAKAALWCVWQSGCLTHSSESSTSKVTPRGGELESLNFSSQWRSVEPGTVVPVEVHGVVVSDDNVIVVLSLGAGHGRQVSKL